MDKWLKLSFSLGRLLHHGLKPVAELMLGVDVANTAGVFFDLSAQLVDCDPKTLYVPGMFRAP
jgi:hypothetical protein